MFYKHGQRKITPLKDSEKARAILNNKGLQAFDRQGKKPNRGSRVTDRTAEIEAEEQK